MRPVAASFGVRGDTVEPDEPHDKNPYDPCGSHDRLISKEIPILTSDTSFDTAQGWLRHIAIPLFQPPAGEEVQRESENTKLAETGTVLIAVRDQVLAESLLFSLELEGYEARFCEQPLERLTDVELRTCLLLDQEVFATLWDRRGTGVLAQFDLPTVLMVNQRTQRLIDHAMAAGVTSVVEKPLLGGILLDAIRSALDGSTR
jgi:hypothetical protein